MDHKYVTARAILFLFLYGGIYGYPYIGGWAFAPWYILISFYAFVVIAVYSLVLGLYKLVQEQMAKIPVKKEDKWWWMFAVIDISLIYIMKIILEFNGFPDMAAYMPWLMGVSAFNLFGAFMVKTWHKA